MTDLRRRTLLGTALASPLAVGTPGSAETIDRSSPIISFADRNDARFLGGEVWANPMEDWRIVDGRATVMSDRAARNLHSLVYVVENPAAGFAVRIPVRRVAEADQSTNGNAADGHPTGRRPANGRVEFGFRVGVNADVDDHRAACFAADGLEAGVRGGRLFIGEHRGEPDVRVPIDCVVSFSAESSIDGISTVRLTLSTDDGDLVDEVRADVATGTLAGNVAVVNGFGTDVWRRGLARHAFGDWSFDGPGVSHHPGRAFGPLLWTMYTVDVDPSLPPAEASSDATVRLNVLAAPIGEDDDHRVTLSIDRGDGFTDIADASIEPGPWVASFVLNDFDATADVPFRITLPRRARSGEASEPATLSGTIRHNPVDRPLRFAAMTCQKDYGFPYAPVAENLQRLDPDLLYFSGDQLYEDHGGYGVLRDGSERSVVNYLRKFYQFGWAFRDSMADRPTLCIPDDHDVFHGNLWGEAGKALELSPGEKMQTSTSSGYSLPVDMVNVVHRTNAGHHPPAARPDACGRGISSYFGELNFGSVSFAILADRQYKSGPEHVDTGPGRADHVTRSDFDLSRIDVEGLELLGPDQEAWLAGWAEDESRHRMRVVLSQTVFSGLATHHGGYDGYLKADLDSGGWPQAARGRAVELLRRAHALHVNGDQHLMSLSQYGVEKQRDAGWAFCVPAIAAGYPRWWRPDELGLPHDERPEGDRSNTGQYRDAFDNLAYVYRVGNPESQRGRDRYETAHRKGSGFGLVTVNPATETYRLNAFRFAVDATAEEGSQFDGFPVTIHRDENAGRNRLS